MCPEKKTNKTALGSDAEAEKCRSLPPGGTLGHTLIDPRFLFLISTPSTYISYAETVEGISFDTTNNNLQHWLHLLIGRQ